MHYILHTLRRIVRYLYRIRLKNKNITLITNNCVGGIICHDLHLRFMSPTVNLYLTNDDFILFCSNLNEYLALEVYEYKQHDKTFPVGILSGSKGDVYIYFMHYKNFVEAKSKWDERKVRINNDNIFIIMEAQKSSEESLLKFNSIPYKNKVVLTAGKIPSIMQSFPIEKNFYENNYWPGKLLEYPRYGIKRYLDVFDYVHFFNTKKIRKRYV